MWTCPKCNRNFKTQNQSHSCVTKDVGELFVGRPDDLVLAFDAIMSEVMTWEPCTMGASVNTVVFTNHKAWLIVRPMTKELDVKFYFDEILEGDELKKVTSFGKKFAHHIRIKHEDEVTPEVFGLLRKGFEFGLG